MGTSLNELKTGREKLEIINQVLARISTISEAIDNTRLDEVIGLKQACEALKNECLDFKNNIDNKNDDILSKYNDINNKYSKINEKYSDLNAKFDYINVAYEDFNLNKEELKNIKDFLENNKEEFEKLKKDIQKYEEIKFNLENYINEIKQNKDFVEDYFNLNTKIKDEILSELDHALEIVENLHLNIDELKEIKPDLVNIKKEVKDLANEAKFVVSEASEIIKNKINTIFFENQRLNAEMIDAVKKLEEIKFDVGVKYKEIASAYDLLLESKQNIEDLREVIALYKEFENDVLEYAQIIKDFKNQIANLEQDLISKSENIHASLDNKQDEILKNLNGVKNETLIKFDELVAKCEGYKVHFEQSYDKFNQRALIANEDLGRLTELAKKELGNDKLIYETELKSLRDETIATMNKISSDLSSEKNNALIIFDEKKQEFINLVDTSKIMINNLNNIFNTNYQEKKNELGLFINENLENLSQNKEHFLKELEDKKEQGKNELENKTDESLQILNTTKTNILKEINAINDTAKNEIEQLKDISLNSISEVKNNADTEISKKKDEIILEFSQATSDFNNIKEEAFLQIEQAKLEQGEKITKLEEEQKSINLNLKTKATLLSQNIILRVGQGETYTTLEDALNEAARYKGLYKDAPKIEILLKSGYEIEKGLKFTNGYYGYITLSSEESEVKYKGNDYEFLIVENFATAFNINSIITNDTLKFALKVEGGFIKINQNKGFKNFKNGVNCLSGFVDMRFAMSVGMKEQCLYASHNGFINAYGANLQGFDNQADNKHNIYCGYAAMMDISYSDISNGLNLGINNNGGYIMAINLKTQNLNIKTGSFLNCYGGGIINVAGTNKESIHYESTANFSNIALNTHTKNGLIIN